MSEGPVWKSGSTPGTSSRSSGSERGPLRIVVFGYHTIGYHCLKELLDRGEEVCAVVTHRDDPQERIWFESVAELARAAGVPVLAPNRPNTPAGLPPPGGPPPRPPFLVF